MEKDAIHPIETRYRSEKMAVLFTETAKLDRWLRVEAALAYAHAAVGNIPQEIAKDIDQKANTKYVKLNRVKEIDLEIDHDLMAMVRGLTEQCSKEAGKYIHLGATSYDIEDTATAVQLTLALDEIKECMKKCLQLLIDLADTHKGLLCVGRTHGQHALPTTYGMRFALWSAEFDRHLERIDQARSRIAVGKMSGAVGTMASFKRKGIEIQKKVMERLATEFRIPLHPVLLANQVIQRDRHAEILNLIGLIGGTIDKIAREFRILQRSEIGELFEPFSKHQVGSSTMPQKRNPHRSERLCSLARKLKANMIVGIDNIVLEDERDITNSGNERMIWAESFILLHYMLEEFAAILNGLEFNFTAITRNLNLTHGAFLAENVMVELVNRGMGRQIAHELLRQATITARDQNIDLIDVLKKDQRVMQLLSEAEIRPLLTPENYIGLAHEQVEQTISYLRAKHSS